MGVINYRDKSERAAAAERSKKNAYKERTAMEREMREKELELREREIALMEREQKLRNSKPSLPPSKPVAESDWKVLGVDNFKP